MNKKTKYSLYILIGILWGIISVSLWIMTSGGPTSGANPPIAFMILTLPASIPLVISSYLDKYEIIGISSTLLVISIPIIGASLGYGFGYLFEKYKK